jgi:sec-independent protein translocase protein TatC
MNQSRDLFDDSTMTFGEHLEALRIHLIRALLGLVIVVTGCLFYGDSIVALVRKPIDDALKIYDKAKVTDDLELGEGPSPFSWEGFQTMLGWATEEVDPNSVDPDTGEVIPALPTKNNLSRTVTIEVLPSELMNVLHHYDAEKFPKTARRADEETVALRIAAPEFSQLEKVIERQSQAVTLNVQEAFMTYLKVALIAGIVVASPWLFYQIWLFVAAGLYPHERKYVYTYLPLSLFLFIGGATFCFVLVFPFVLKFLLGFNALLHVQPQIRLSEWITFAVTLPLMFGLSFQLPMVMLFLERISLFEVVVYREKRRMAILVIAFLSMILTPADPMSMMLMMFPLVLLYEFGIILCVMNPRKPAFDDEPAAA